MPIFRGVWPALVTPFTPDNHVNLGVLKDIIEYLISKGVDGFYVGGTTGEGIFMPVADRKLLVENVQAEVNGRVPVIVHAGAVALGDAVDLARHARDKGAVGVSSVLPPLYENFDSLRVYYESVAAAVSDLPFMPYLLNPRIDPVALMRQIMHIPNFGGTKYTGPNMFELRQMIDLGGGKWTMFSGMDEQCLYAAMMGATGNIGSTLNFMPGVYKRIHQYLEDGDYTLAQDLQVRANRVTAVLTAAGFPGALKAVMGKLGFDCGQPRLPGLPLTDEQRKTLFRDLDASDFAELAAM